MTIQSNPNKFKIEMFKTNLETAFNVAGSIPGLNTISGPLRATIAKVELIASAVFIFYATVKASSSKTEATREMWLQRKRETVKYLPHTALNIIRGCVEATLVGSAAFLIYQILNEDFRPQYKYDCMKRQHLFGCSNYN